MGRPRRQLPRLPPIYGMAAPRPRDMRRENSLSHGRHKYTFFMCQLIVCNHLHWEGRFVLPVGGVVLGPWSLVASTALWVFTPIGQHSLTAHTGRDASYPV